MTAPPRPSHIDRFIITDVLGHGSEASVYLATDPDLNRNVAIKSLHLHSPLERQEQIDLLFSDARTISQLQHPNIVPIYELGVDNMQPYLVLEYIEGSSLKDRLKTKLRSDEIFQIMRDVLNGVAAAHHMNIIHGDLKPTNVLLNCEGKAKVTDFGISRMAESEGESADQLIGTPRYMAPEYIETRRQRKVSDVFSLGLLFYELLTGKPAIRGKDIDQISNQIADIVAPSKLDPAIDQRLDALVSKALERDPDRRFEDAGRMLEAFIEYLSEKIEVDGNVSNESTMSFLLGRIKRKKDFLIFSQTLCLLNQAADDENDDIGKVSSVILNDVSLSDKILNMANSVYYNRSGGNISTISRAVLMLGIDQIRRLAVTLMLFDHIQNSSQSDKLKEEAVLSLLSALIAGELAKAIDMSNHEDAFLCAMLHRLGKMMVRYYFYDESKSVDMLMAQHKFSESQASTRILGVSYNKLGIAVAREWGFPEKMVDCLETINPNDLPDILDDKTLLQLVANFGNQLGDTQRLSLIEQAPSILTLVDKFSRYLNIDASTVSSLLATSIKALSEFTSVIKFDLITWLYDKSEGFHARADILNEDKDLATRGSQLPDSIEIPHKPLDQQGKPVEQLLNRGIYDVTYALTGDYNLNQVVKHILKTIHRAFDGSRVLFVVKDSGSGTLKGRIGYGDDIDNLISRFCFPVSQNEDVFNISLRKKAAVRVRDIEDARIKSKIPPWYHKVTGATCFTLVPIVFDNTPFGLIYIEYPMQKVRITDTQLNALKTMGNQLILAIKGRR